MRNNLQMFDIRISTLIMLDSVKRNARILQYMWHEL